MRRKIRRIPFFVAAATLLVSVLSSADDDVIRIGEINAYKALPALTVPYRKGWELAQEEINAQGGVLGKRLETVFRDSNANAGEAVRAAQELVTLEKVDMLAGVTFSHVGLAVSDFARHRKVFFLASGPFSDAIIWSKHNRYTYRLRAGTYAMVAAVIDDAVALNKKRWALVYPNYEYGQVAAETFKREMKKRQPDVEFVIEQAPPYGKVDAGLMVQALEDARPDAIFNVLFGADLTRFLREGHNRGLFENREVVSLMSGEPEYSDSLKGDAPKNWIVTGYPYYSLDMPEHQDFIEKYRAKYDDYPRMNSVVAYATVKALAAGIEKAGSTDAEDLVEAFKGLEFSTPFGVERFSPVDNQSSMGVIVGRSDLKDGRGYMKTWKYLNGDAISPPLEERKALVAGD
ncbi:ABC transporter substrate-binding protein [Alloalcanivorax gelatiniphagus]|uniref:ABC transporter substrate-binding protein n=1 Tax=Alloalcanivorax gelatiniphagus TaxID=1194167 RepID=A0ABY2XJW2_9GAMM|nr:ABC transporter substrate-binding protein [Alloalcanivorax gelatiniphagus]